MSFKRMLIALSGLTGVGAIGVTFKFEEVRHYTSEILDLFEGCSWWSGCFQRAAGLNTVNLVGIVTVAALGVVPIAGRIFRGVVGRGEHGTDSRHPVDKQPGEPFASDASPSHQTLTFTVMTAGDVDVTAHVRLLRPRIYDGALKAPHLVVPLNPRPSIPPMVEPANSGSSGLPVNRSCAVKMDRCKRTWSGQIFSLSETGCLVDIGSQKFRADEAGTIFVEVGWRLPWTAPRAVSCRFIVTETEESGRLHVIFDHDPRERAFDMWVSQVLGREIFKNKSNGQ